MSIMAIYRVFPPLKLQCEVSLPASKSISNRALIINALSGNGCRPQNISDCDDTRVMVNALSNMPPVIDILAAGTAMRFLTAYLSAMPGETHVITGTERMRHRPIEVLVEALRSLGAEIAYAGEEGFPPLRITGRRLMGGRLSLPGNVSSQYISALLMIAPTMKYGLELTLVGGIISRPYIDMTLSIMERFGASAAWTAENVLKVDPVPYQPTPFFIENDWSAASYWYQMVALSSDASACVTLPGLFADSTQGDSAVARLFEPLGVRTEYTKDGVRLAKGEASEGAVEESLISQPDLAQTLVVTCAMLGRPFVFGGLQTLRIKETDRIAALQQEMAKLGYVLRSREVELANGKIDLQLLWSGERTKAVTHPAIATYEDHRMAMAFAPCALMCEGIGIEHPEVVTKSYPGYWDALRTAGFQIEEL